MLRPCRTAGRYDMRGFNCYMLRPPSGSTPMSLSQGEVPFPVSVTPEPDGRRVSGVSPMPHGEDARLCETQPVPEEEGMTGRDSLLSGSSGVTSVERGCLGSPRPLALNLMTLGSTPRRDPTPKGVKTCREPKAHGPTPKGSQKEGTPGMIRLQDPIALPQ